MLADRPPHRTFVPQDYECPLAIALMGKQLMTHDGKCDFILYPMTLPELTREAWAMVKSVG